MITPGQRMDPRTARPPGRGLAATSLALGLASVPALVACGLGLLLALVGLVTGIIALVRTWTGRRPMPPAPEGAVPGTPGAGTPGAGMPGAGIPGAEAPDAGRPRVAGVRVMALAGIVLSLITLVAGAWLLSKAAECGDESRYPDEESRRICVEREFPFAAEQTADQLTEQPLLDHPGLEQPGLDGPGLNEPGLDEHGLDQPGE